MFVENSSTRHKEVVQIPHFWFIAMATESLKCWIKLFIAVHSGEHCGPWASDCLLICIMLTFEPVHDKTKKMTCVPCEDCPVWSVFAVRMKKHWALNYLLSAQWRLWSDWADAQADLNLHWAQSHFVGFIMRWIHFICLKKCNWG